MLLYNVPARLASSFASESIVIRSHDPEELVASVEQFGEAQIAGVQLLTLREDTSALQLLEEPLNLELVVSDSLDVPKLYHYIPFASLHQLCVVIQVSSGMLKAVRVVQALSLPARLVMGQPDDSMLEELRQALDFYLHDSSARTPLEPFQSLLTAFYGNSRTNSLWWIQGEDPACNRYVHDDGRVEISKRFEASESSPDLTLFPVIHKKRVLIKGSQCTKCDFYANCLGYFKIPQPDYDCNGIIQVLKSIRSAGKELRRDLSSYGRKE